MNCVLEYNPSLVSQEDNAALLKPIELDEVKEAVFSLSPDSAPGPDGFSGSFYQACWPIISSDLLLGVQEFMTGVPIPQGIACSSIVLIPNKD